MAINTNATIQRAIDNRVRLLFLVTEAIANPTEANIDAAVADATGQGIVLPRPNYSEQGVSVQWESYARHLGDSLVQLQKLFTVLGGSFEVRSRGV